MGGAAGGAVAVAAGGGENFTRNGRKPQQFDWAAIKLFTIQSIQLWQRDYAAYACCALSPVDRRHWPPGEVTIHFTLKVSIDIGEMKPKLCPL